MNPNPKSALVIANLALGLFLTGCVGVQAKITAGLDTIGNDTVTVAKDIGTVGAGAVALGTDAVKVSAAVVIALSPVQPDTTATLSK